VGQKRADDSRSDGDYRHPDPVTDEALDWFLRLREDHDPETATAFERWRQADPARAEAFGKLSRMHAMPSLHKATLRDAKLIGLGERAPVASVPAQQGSGRWISGIAAVAAMLLIAVGWQQAPALLLQWRSDYRTTAGERDTVSLPDGSTVTLNTATALAIDFVDGRRRISLLAGEAFFEVRHDPSHPFVVAGRFSEVEVKGTAFAVSTDSEGDVVVLERGSVEVSGEGDRTKHAMLKPGEMIVATASGLSPVRNADLDRTLAWREGRIVFYDRPFRQALGDLERYYDGSVVVMTDRVSGRTVSGNYRIDDAEAAIHTLARSAGASVTRLPGGILILR
jgi:transmembrane sensor